jgi:hypothetical protein
MEYQVINDREKVSDIQQKLKMLKTHRQPYEDVWRMIRDFVAPNMGMELNDKKGDTFGSNQFDGTATAAAHTLADGLLGYITTPNGKWFKLGVDAPKTKITEPGKEWLEESEEVFGSIFGKSNFYDGMSKEFFTGATFGTATLWVGDDPKRNSVNFSCRSVWEIFIDTDDQDNVDTILREYKQTGRNIVKKWKGSLPEHFAEKVKEDPYAEYKIIHAVFPREDRDQYKIDGINKAFASIYILDDENHLLSEGGFDTMPYIVWRYTVLPGEKYGRSPAWDALVEIKTSQGIAKTLLEAAHKSVNPPLMVPQEMKGRINLTPNGMNYYLDGSRQIAPINEGINYPVGRDMQEAVQNAIRIHFRTDFFLMWNNSLGQAKTATEIMEMQGEKAAILSSIVSRIDSELLNPLFDRVFGIAFNNGWLPDLPEDMMDMQGAEINVDYIGPLAQAVKKHWNTQQINQTLIQYISLFEVYPELRNRIDPKAIGRFLLEAGGFPEKLIVDDAVYDQAIQAEQEAQAQAMAQQNGVAQAQVFDKLNQSVAPGSPAEGMF